MAEVHKGGKIAGTGGLLHVVGDDKYRVLTLQALDQFFDFAGGDGSSREQGSSMSSTSGSAAIARAMQRRCC